jgi:hypothetical protein
VTVAILCRIAELRFQQFTKRRRAIIGVVDGFYILRSYADLFGSYLLTFGTAYRCHNQRSGIRKSTRSVDKLVRYYEKDSEGGIWLSDKAEM